MSNYVKNFDYIIIDQEGDIVGGANTQEAAEDSATRMITSVVAPISRRQYSVAKVLKTYTAKIEVQTQDR